MEILATVEYKGFFIFILSLLIIITLLFLLLTIVAISGGIQEGFDRNCIMALIICLGLTLFFGFATYKGYINGVQVEYKAKITDFNEVYKNGYVITGQEGEIYTIEKKQ